MPNTPDNRKIISLAALSEFKTLLIQDFNGRYVPYSGADASVNLGANNFITSSYFEARSVSNDVINAYTRYRAGSVVVEDASAQNTKIINFPFASELNNSNTFATREWSEATLVKINDNINIVHSGSSNHGSVTVNSPTGIQSQAFAKIRTYAEGQYAYSELVLDGYTGTTRYRRDYIQVGNYKLNFPSLSADKTFATTDQIPDTSNFVIKNNAITGATKCKITYDSKGLVTGGADLSASDIPDLSGSYLSVEGGDLNGDLLMTGNDISGASNIGSNTFEFFNSDYATIYGRLYAAYDTDENDNITSTGTFLSAMQNYRVGSHLAIKGTFYRFKQKASSGTIIEDVATEQWVTNQGYTTNAGTVTSVGAGTGLSISGTASVNPTVNIASGYKLPTTTEWGQKVSVSDLGRAAYKDFTTSVSNGSNDLVTSGAVFTAIANLPTPMQFKGTLGVGGTISVLPDASASNNGYTYKVISNITYAGQSAKIGDVFVSNGTSWVLIPAGDDVEDTWREIYVNDTSFKQSGISSGKVNFKNGSNVTIRADGDNITISSSYTNSYHKTGSWSGLTYTAENVNTNDNLAFTIPTGTTASTVALGNHNHDSVYLKLAGGTMTGVLTLKGDQYYASNSVYGMNANNSDIVGVNSIYTQDLADTTSEGIRFYRDSTHWDSFTISGGVMYFMANDSKAGNAFSNANVVLHSGNIGSYAALPSSYPNDGGEIKTKNRVALKGYTGEGNPIWYYKLIRLPVDNSGNYASAIINGRIGGWVSENMSSIYCLIWNRNGIGCAVLDIGGAGTMSGIFNTTDIVVYKNSDNTADVYLKCKGYFTFDLDVEVFQSSASITYDGTYVTTTPSGTLGTSASTTTSRIQLEQGVFKVNGTAVSLSGHTHNYAGSSSAGGAATSALKLSNTVKIGDTNQPVYFNASGVPVAISYTIGKSVPSDAKFTDHEYTNGTGLTLSNGQFSISAANVSTILNLLSTGSSTPTDADYYISQYVGGGTTTTTYHRRPMSALWEYIKGKGVVTGIKVGTGSTLSPSSGVVTLPAYPTKASWNYDDTYLKLSGGTLTGNLTFKKDGNTIPEIKFQGSQATYTMIKFLDNTGDANGNGISIGGGGSVVIGAGESANNIVSGAGVIGGTETLYLGSDNNIYLLTNVQSGYASAKTFTFDTSGNLVVPGTISEGGQLLSNKYQAKLTAQTAYSAKGSATKVPQITTNSLGQVTSITEVTITQPTVNNGTLTIKAAGTSKGTFSANQSGNVEINITAADLGLGNAMHFIGSSSTAITDGGTENPTISGYSGTAKTSGNVVLYNGKEYVWTGSAWEQLGDEGSWALKTISISAGTGLTGGGTLEANRTISLADAYGDTKNPYGSKTANYVLASPNGSAGAPSFRSLVAADIPDLGGTYLKLNGGTHAVNFNSSNLPQFDNAPSYLVGIEAFGNGGTLKWAAIGDISVGHAATADYATNSASLNGNGPAYYLNYNNLSNKPTIPSVSNATITIKQTGQSDQTFTLNGSAATITLADNNTHNTHKIISGYKQDGTTQIISASASNGDIELGASGITAGWYKRVYVNAKGIVVNGDQTDADANTWRPVKYGSTTLNDTSTTLEFVAGSNVQLSFSSGKLTISATDTTYESKAAASGGTALSLVTTGEKYTWNNKSNLALVSSGGNNGSATTAARSDHTHSVATAATYDDSNNTWSGGSNGFLTAEEKGYLSYWRDGVFYNYNQTKLIAYNASMSIGYNVAAHQSYTSIIRFPHINADQDVTLATQEWVGNQGYTTDSVSGVNDGTNWTSLTINGVTKTIPSMSGSYLPLSAGSTNTLTGVLYVKAATSSIGGESISSSGDIEISPAANGKVYIEGLTLGSAQATGNGIIKKTSGIANRTYTFPDKTGTVALTTDIKMYRHDVYITFQNGGCSLAFSVTNTTSSAYTTLSAAFKALFGSSLTVHSKTTVPVDISFNYGTEGVFFPKCQLYDISFSGREIAYFTIGVYNADTVDYQNAPGFYWNNSSSNIVKFTYYTNFDATSGVTVSDVMRTV